MESNLGKLSVYHIHVTNQICHCATLAMLYCPGASRYAPQSLTELLPKQVRNKVKQCCPSRKAFSAIFHSFNVKILSSSELEGSSNLLLQHSQCCALILPGM